MEGAAVSNIQLSGQGERELREPLAAKVRLRKVVESNGAATKIMERFVTY